MPKRKKFSELEIRMIVSAICFFRAEKEVLGDLRYPVHEKVSNCLSIGLSTVKHYASLYRDNIENDTPPSKIPKLSNEGRPKIEVDQFTLGVIRRYMYDFFLAKMYPTINKLKEKLERFMPDFPSMSSNSLRKIVHNIGFRFKKLNNKPVLMESVSVAASRHAYLKKIKKLREQGYKIFYTDETWCGQNHTMRYAWQENIIEAVNQGYTNYDQYRGAVQEVNGWRGGFKTPSGAGKRVIILHIGSEDGFLDGAELCFVGKKGTSDYHNEMNGKHYEEWFRKVLNILPKKSAVVLDQAPYHTMVDPATRNPTMTWLKKDIIQWIKTRNIPLPPDTLSFEKLTKPALITYARHFFGTPKKILEETTKETRPDVDLIWLPVAHCELNPIELIWAFVKNNIAKTNRKNAAEKGNSINVTRDLCEEMLKRVTPELWKKCIIHTEKVERIYWEKDHLMDEAPVVEPVIIDLAESTSSDSEFEENCDDGISDFCDI